LAGESTPGAREVLAGLPAARRDGATLRASVRAIRAADNLLLGVLDDDPTGSQAVHGIQAVNVLAESAVEAALDGPAAACFVLTNTRSLSERDAVELTELAARGLYAVAGRRGARLQLVSRSDSTLRGHVIAEVRALQAVRRERTGAGFDAVLLIPAFLEAGRLTAANVQWARTGADLVPVSETEYARDPVFGYVSSDLRDFVVEKARGTMSPASAWPISGSVDLPASPNCSAVRAMARGLSSTRPTTPTWRPSRAGCCWPSRQASRFCSAPARPSCAP
jgi:hypothetical protein